ncbi:hypothetical protein PO883_28785 [Massilia sp. DJPM01]|uniref:hypothetical protein n=1 Tax=Massilia sp. DJPM01 TaxID=3024404 RepID=UPI00259E605B|nr:hypothetical protein [Massilia sp. DJPM01]MDM5181183.1 hypothetical protein [Massilia sp. DJPM01]
MAKTNSERQRAYRATRATAGENGQRQLNMWVDTGTALALARLANRYSITKQEMIARLISQADDGVIATINEQSPQWDIYMRPKGKLGR